MPHTAGLTMPEIIISTGGAGIEACDAYIQEDLQCLNSSGLAYTHTT